MTCVMLMWSNEIKCEHMFMFPLKNLAHKGLIAKQSCQTFLSAVSQHADGLEPLGPRTSAGSVSSSI